MANILSFLGWSILPDLTTNNLLTFYYRLTLPAGTPSPAPNTSTYHTHRRRIYTSVILLYLAYTLYEAHWDISRRGDFYSLLGVAHDANEKVIQSRFRKLTLLHHPDKLPTNAPTGVLAQRQEHYVLLTTARDFLLDPARRFAYDRLGPTITAPGWARLRSVPDFISAGLRQLVPFYVSSALGLWISTWLGLLDNGGEGGLFWRYLALAVMGVIEVHALTRPWFTFITLIPALGNPYFRALAQLPGLGWAESWIREGYLPFQAVQVAHRGLIAFLIALSRLGPLVRAGKEELGSGEEALAKRVGRLEQVTQMNCMESARLLGLEMVPFRTAASGEDRGDEVSTGSTRRDPGLERLRVKIKEWLVTNTIRESPGVKRAVERLRNGEGDGVVVGD